VNDVVTAFGLEGWKGLADLLLLPPVPLLLMVLVGARLMYRRRLLAWSLILLGCLGLWFSTTMAVGKLMRSSGMHPVPPPLSSSAIEALKQEAEDARRARREPTTAIVVLGGGRRTLSPEYGMSNLTPTSMERLRYGLWLARQTGLPLAFAGGVGHGARAGASEAEIASRIAEREFGLHLRWTESRSRDTVENGQLMAPVLQAAGVRRIVLVTHDYHERRAVRAFERGAERQGQPMAVLPAPVGLLPLYEWSVSDFLPSPDGFLDTRRMLHEWLGYLLGA